MYPEGVMPADESTYCSIAEMAQKLAAANGIRVRFALEEGRGRGYPEPVNMNMDTSHLRALGWPVGKRGISEFLFWGRDDFPKDQILEGEDGNA